MLSQSGSLPSENDRSMTLVSPCGENPAHFRLRGNAPDEELPRITLTGLQ
jgi:hypothetical protein